MFSSPTRYGYACNPICLLAVRGFSRFAHHRSWSLACRFHLASRGAAHFVLPAPAARPCCCPSGHHRSPQRPNRRRDPTVPPQASWPAATKGTRCQTREPSLHLPFLNLPTSTPRVQDRRRARLRQIRWLRIRGAGPKTTDRMC